MCRPIRTLVVLGVLLSLGSCLLAASGEKRGPGLPYRTALDYLADLDLDRAYKCTHIVYRDFPESREAGNARLLRAIISTIRLQSFDMLRRKYGEAVEKAVLYEDKKRSSDLYIEAAKEVVGNGKRLVGDVEALFGYVGRPMTIEIKKKHDDLELLSETYRPYKMLESGFPPVKEEKGKVEKLQYNMSLYYILGRVLGGTPLGDEEMAEDFRKKRAFKGDVDWVGCMTVIGDWLIHYAAVCKVGSREVRDMKQARSAYETAGRCFERVVELSRGGRYGKERAHGKERIKEIKDTLRKMR